MRKKICLLCSISPESYIIWLSYMVLMFKMIIPSGVFFHRSKILIFWVVRGIKGQKIAQNYKKVCGAWYLRNHTSYDHHLWCIRNCKMIISLGVFLFFQNFDFWVVRRVKGQKWPKMTKKLRPLHFISQEPYIIWSWFMAHIFKRLISPDVYTFFFQMLIFGVNSGVKEQKVAWNDKRLCLPHSISE